MKILNKDYIVNKEGTIFSKRKEIYLKPNISRIIKNINWAI